MQKLEIYTDGGCHGNPGPGAWAAILKWGNAEKLLSGYVPHTTNNRMEVSAAIEALKVLKRPVEVALYSDSQYLIKGITDYIHNWKRDNWQVAEKKRIKNLDLWKMLNPLVEKHLLTWHWVRGHSGHFYNEKVDKIVQETIKQNHSS
tara:strand:- start:699 stop:1139 length:441 start_codon:yes stop_codon:yes gene_type:complete